MATRIDMRPRADLGQVGLHLFQHLRLAGAMALLTIGLAPLAALARLETWRQEGPTAFAKCHRESVVVSDSGRARLGQAVSPLGVMPAARVWDLARTREGALLAATGDSGQVFRRDAKPDAAWTVYYDSTDSQALSLVVCPDGRAYLGTGPNGQVVDLTDPKHPASRPDPKVRYIWDLAADPDGNLYAATGPDGQLWKRSRAGKWSLAYDSKAAHLLCVAIGPDGSVYTGGDGEGLVYRLGRDGKATILFDAPQSEIRALLVAPDGSVYAGTAAESGGGSGNRSSLFLTRSAVPPALEGLPSDGHAGARGEDGIQANEPTQAQPRRLAPDRPGPRPPGSAGGSATPRPITPGDNAVYRLDADGVPREVLRVKALIHALAWAGDHLVVGTGPEGQLYEVRNQGDETAPIAKLDHGQVLALLAEPGGGILMGTGDPGSVLRLSSDYVPEGRLVSEVHDGKLLSRFGALGWRAERPPGTSITVQARTGNVGEPDETWSAWSAEQTDPSAAHVASPPGRFVQYRVKLATTDPRHTPELRSVSVSYRTSNLAPEISRLDVPDLSAADGAARAGRLNLRWDTADPNDDELNYRLMVRKEGWPFWIDLTEEPITERTYAWDTTTFPSGSYRVKLIASDRPSNRPDEAATRERESVSFLVDHDPPHVRLTPREGGAKIELGDDLTRLVKADYAIDGGPWTPIFPDDALFDSLLERITLSLPDLKPGSHLLMVRTTDAAGNVGAADVLIEAKKEAHK
jgi:hypothetical protein